MSGERRTFGDRLREPKPRALFYRACAVGGVLATLVFAWLVFLGTSDLTRLEPLGNFYEVQAESLLDGHWDVPPRSLAFERFNIDGRFFMYQGPWPAILRMPFVAFSDDLDGQLSRLSMLLAFVIFVCFCARLAWQARVLLRGEGRPTRASMVAAGAFVFVAGCGSSALYLGSRSWVYHEAIMWGVTWTVVSISFLLSYLQSGRGRDLWLTCGATTLAVLSRGSVGAAAVLVLGAVLVLQLVARGSARVARRRTSDEVVTSGRERIDARLARWCGVPDHVVERPLLPSLVALAVPVALYAYVNYEKFGSLFGLPIAKQDLLRHIPSREAALEESATLFSPKFAPTNLLQYFRPDAIGFDSLFPWVTFSRPLTNVGDIPFDNIEPSASITAVSTLLLVLAILGVVATVRAPRGESDGSVASFRLPILACAAVTGGAVLLGVHFHRYEGDFVPFLVVAGAAGLFFLPVILVRRTQLQRRLIAAVLVVLGAWSCWATFSLALRYQRTVSAFGDTPARQDFIDFQLDIADALGGWPEVDRGPELPFAGLGEEFRDGGAPLGAMFVVGDCDGLYISSRKGWEAIEQRFPGARRWKVTFGDPKPGDREPVWSDASGRVVWARWLDREHVVFDYDESADGPTIVGTEALRVRPGEEIDLDVRFDPSTSYLEVKDGDRVLLAVFPPGFTTVVGEELGRQPDAARGARRFGGSIEQVDLVPLCHRVLEHLESTAPTSASTNDSPPRVLVYGDSLLSEARNYVQDAFRRNGLDVTTQAFPGTGLCDWASEMPADAGAVEPDVVVIALSGVTYSACNQYDSGAGARCLAEGGSYDECVEAEQQRHWRRDAEQIAALWKERGVDVLWVSALPEPGATEPAPISSVYRSVASRHGQDFDDVAQVLRDGDGSWPVTLPCEPDETGAEGCIDGRIQVRRSETNGHLCPIEPDTIGPCPVYSSGVARWGDRLAASVRRVLDQDERRSTDQVLGASAGSRPVRS